MSGLVLHHAVNGLWSRVGTSSTIIPPAADAISNGQEINASNTGLNFAGVSESNLVVTNGATYSVDGQVIENRLFTDAVILSGNNITIRNCRITISPGANNKAIIVTGSGCTLEGLLVDTASGSGYMGVDVRGDNLTVQRCNISSFENNITISASGTLIDESYLHDSSTVTNPGGHRDCIEIYAGAGHVIRKSRLTHPTAETAVINIAPWFTGASVSGVDIIDNMLDGGNMLIIADNQSAGIFNVRILRNKMGGHTAVSPYLPRRDADGNDPVIVRTPAEQSLNAQSLLWPTTGFNINIWAECDDLTPNLNGDTVT